MHDPITAGSMVAQIAARWIAAGMALVAGGSPGNLDGRVDGAAEGVAA